MNVRPDPNEGHASACAARVEPLSPRDLGEPDAEKEACRERPRGEQALCEGERDEREERAAESVPGRERRSEDNRVRRREDNEREDGEERRSKARQPRIVDEAGEDLVHQPRVRRVGE